MVETDIEYLDSKIALLTPMLPKVFVKNQDNIHRQIVEVRRQLIEFKKLRNSIEDSTGIDILPYVKIYMDM